MYSVSDSLPIPEDQPFHILLVEDNISQRITLGEWLRLEKYIVYEATTTDEAAKLLVSPLLHIDLVIADIWLPGMLNGWDFGEYLRHTYPLMPVIVTSGVYKNVEVGEHMAFFQKPYNLEDISLQISKMLHKKKEEGGI